MSKNKPTKQEDSGAKLTITLEFDPPEENPDVMHIDVPKDKVDAFLKFLRETGLELHYER